VAVNKGSSRGKPRLELQENCWKPYERSRVISSRVLSEARNGRVEGKVQRLCTCCLKPKAKAKI